MLAPFHAGDVGAFVPAYASQARLMTYGVVGGLPGHLSLLDPALDLAGNAAALLLDPAGRLADEAQHMLDALIGDAAVHYSILEAVATGEHTRKGITSRIGRSGGAAQRPLEWLIDMHVLSRTVPITEAAPQKSRWTLYRVTDPYVGFWHRFVAPLVAAGSVGLVPPERLWASAVAPRLDDYMGAVFEETCRHAVRAGTLPLPFPVSRVGEWWDAASQEQVDVVAVGADGGLLVGECKWGEVTGRDLATLERRARRLRRGGRPSDRGRARARLQCGRLGVARSPARPARTRTRRRRENAGAAAARVGVGGDAVDEGPLCGARRALSGVRDRFVMRLRRVDASATVRWLRPPRVAPRVAPRPVVRRPAAVPRPRRGVDPAA